MADESLIGQVPARARDPRIDFFRGLALLMIFINHVPGQVYENFTSRNIGFSDAAEAFVFMSGLAAALAYSPKLLSGLNWLSLRKIWGRAWQLYVVHIFITFGAIAIFAAGAKFLGAYDLLDKNGVGYLFQMPLEFMIGTMALTQQLGYVNILPLYSVLLLAAPFMIRLAQTKPWWLLSGSLLLWAICGFFRINFINYPVEGGWFLNPFSWQLIFALGILTGVKIREGKRFVGVWAPLIVMALLYAAFSCAAVQWPALRELVGQIIVSAREAGAPAFIVDFEKTYVGIPRLLHLLALVYLLSLPWVVPKVAASRIAKPVRVIGKHGLPIFAAGTLLALVGQALKTAYDLTLLQDTLLIWGGIVALYLFAAVREWLANKERNAGKSAKLAVFASANNGEVGDRSHIHPRIGAQTYGPPRRARA